MITTLFSIIAWVVAHQSLLLIVTTCLLAFEQWLGSTDRLKSNSTMQLIGNISGGIINVLRIVYKISTGTAMVTVLDGTRPPVTPAQPVAPLPTEKIRDAISSPANEPTEGQDAVPKTANESASALVDSALKSD